jgi:hypothetical protein
MGLACDRTRSTRCVCCAQPPDKNVPDDVQAIPHEAQDSAHCLTHALVNLLALILPNHPHVTLTHSSIMAVEVLEVVCGPHGQSRDLSQSELRDIARGMNQGSTVDAATKALQLLGVSFDFVARASSLLNPDEASCTANVVSWLNPNVLTKPPAALMVKSRTHYYLLTLFQAHPTLMTNVDSRYAATPVILYPGFRALMSELDHVFVCHAPVDSRALLHRVRLLELQGNAFLARLDQHLSAYNTGTAHTIFVRWCSSTNFDRLHMFGAAVCTFFG